LSKPLCAEREHPFDAEVFRCLPSLPLTSTGQSLISHAGVSVLTGFLDGLGFGRLCEDKLSQFVPAGTKHRPGRLVGSLTAMLAAGGEHASDLDIQRSSPGVFGQLPSNATVSRFFERTVTHPELLGYGFETLTQELRTRAWYAARNRKPCLVRDGCGSANYRYRRDPGDPVLG
jgi:hypothetical protein